MKKKFRILEAKLRETDSPVDTILRHALETRKLPRGSIDHDRKYKQLSEDMIVRIIEIVKRIFWK